MLGRMTLQKFMDREDAARRLAAELKGRSFHAPVVLAIPRGGVVTGAILARELNAELDVVLARKLRAPTRPELAIGAVSESGQVFVNEEYAQAAGASAEYLERETRHQLSEIDRRMRLFRAVRPKVSLESRTVIVTDDGIATGSTVIAALQTVRAQRPRELIVAVPVISTDRVAEISRWCDEFVCLISSDDFYAVGQFYRDFDPVEDDDAVRLIGQFAPAASSA